jgi:peptidoglycan hydrolase-like protein with peptidoglycan-binding domain
MDRWKNILALTVAGLFVAGPVLAQSSAPAGSDTPKPGPTGQDPAKPYDPSAPSAAPKSDTMKPDGMKSDTMKPDTMKPDQPGKAAAARGNREQVKAAQQALRDKGHDPGSTDGVMGPKTQAALKEFQKAQGLTATGRLDAETMAKLGVEGKTSQIDSSSPSASPQTAPGASPRPEPGTAKDKQPPTGKPQTR